MAIVVLTSGANGANSLVDINNNFAYLNGQLISSLNFVDNETVSGSGTTYTLANTPIVGSEHIFARGQRLAVGLGDYTISGKIITTTASWASGDLLADYRK